ncbi:sensor domain-containing diguanylate cyclase [Marinospirillum minutulum]|uniref:sensor domain-containing diguanylate cyclase n=1 Tax=Marinospirillum minutulum TaxID=64974 RepID=UPI00146A7357|nr:diguanylate cyclase [Marinospirillum minutulum]
MSYFLLKLKKIRIHSLIVILSFIGISITLFGGFYASYKIQKSELLSNTIQNNMVYVSKVASSIDYFNFFVTRQISKSVNSLFKDQEGMYLVENELRSFFINFNVFNGFFITNNNGDLINDKGNKYLLDNNNIQNILTKPYDADSDIDAYIIFTGDEPSLVLRYPLKFDSQLIGFAFGIIDFKTESVLKNIISDHYHTDGSYTFLLNNNDFVIYHPDREKIGTKKITNQAIEKNKLKIFLKNKIDFSKFIIINNEGDNFLGSSVMTSESKFKVVIYRPIEKTVKIMEETIIKVLLNTFIIGVIVILVIYFFAKLISRPINQLAEEVYFENSQGLKSRIKCINAWYFESSRLKSAILKGIDLVGSQIIALEAETVTDSLTGLYNRRGLNKLILDLNSTKSIYSVLAIDIDYFKQVNDKFGHGVGDLVLIDLAKIMMSLLNEGESIARTGGEEFIYIIPKKDEHYVINKAELIRSKVAEYKFNTVGSITVSIGIATSLVVGENKSDLINNADNALYSAKRLGRNKTVVYFDE